MESANQYGLAAMTYHVKTIYVLKINIRISWQPKLHGRAYTPSLIPRPFPPPVTK